jgi:hypothetical protein
MLMRAGRVPQRVCRVRVKAAATRNGVERSESLDTGEQCPRESLTHAASHADFDLL